MQEEVIEKLARQIMFDYILDIDYDYDYLSTIVEEDYPGANVLTEGEFEMLCDRVDSKIKNARVIVKFGR